MKSSLYLFCLIRNGKIKNDDDEQIIQIRLSLTPSDHDFTGVVHATKCMIVKEKECLSDYDNVNQDNMIRSKADNVSLTLSHCRKRIPIVDEQLNQQEKQTNHDDYININQQPIVHSIKMKNDIKMITQHENDLYDNDYDDDDEHYSDESNYSDDLRYLHIDFILVKTRLFICILLNRRFIQTIDMFDYIFEIV
jgi:hypothetical protein